MILVAGGTGTLGGANPAGYPVTVRMYVVPAGTRSIT